MTDLWFDRDLDRIAHRGALVYTARPGRVWAVLVTERTFPDDLGQESAELLGTYGAAAHGIGHLLLGDGVTLPRDLERWATAPDIPSAELGGWHPVLLSVDDHACLAVARDFGDHRVHATTLADGHLTVLAPRTTSPVRLRHRE